MVSAPSPSGCGISSDIATKMFEYPLPSSTIVEFAAATNNKIIVTKLTFMTEEVAKKALELLHSPYTHE